MELLTKGRILQSIQNQLNQLEKFQSLREKVVESGYSLPDNPHVSFLEAGLTREVHSLIKPVFNDIPIGMRIVISKSKTTNVYGFCQDGSPEKCHIINNEVELSDVKAIPDWLDEYCKAFMEVLQKNHNKDIGSLQCWESIPD